MRVVGLQTHVLRQCLQLCLLKIARFPIVSLCFSFFIIGLRSSDDNSIITGDCLQAIGHYETLLCRQIPKASSDICNLFAFEPFTGDAHVSLVCISIHTGHPHHCVMQVTKVIQVMRDFLSARVLQVEGIKSESTASGRVFRL